MSKIIIKICLIVYLIIFSYEGSALDIQNQILLMPYPQIVTLNYSSSEIAVIDSNINLDILTSSCTGECESFLKDHFDDIIKTQVKMKEKLTDFKVSLHEAYELPRPEYSSGASIERI